MRFQLNKHRLKTILLLCVLIIGFVIFLTPLLISVKQQISIKENQTLVITNRIKESLKIPKCYKSNEKIVCENNVLKIINEVPDIIDENNTARLIDWFMEKVAYGPEIMLLDSILLSKERCNERKELNCSGVTRFFDSKKSQIILYPYTIIKGEKFISEPLVKRASFHDLTYFIAHEYYHHVTQQTLYDLSPTSNQNQENSVVDSAGIAMAKNEGSFSTRRSKYAVNNFLSANSLDINKQDFLINGVYSKNCPLSTTSRSSLYKWSNEFKKDVCVYSWRFPPFQAASENSFYPKNTQYIKPTSLINCGYFANSELPPGNVEYYFTLDEILVRQLVQLTFYEGSSQQIGKRISCHRPIIVKNKKIGENNDFLLDYYLLNKMGFSVFKNNPNFNYETATDEQKKNQEKTNEVLATNLLKSFFQEKLSVSSLMYNQQKKEYSIGGYLNYNNDYDSFVKDFNNKTWFVKNIVAININSGEKKLLAIKQRHNLYYVNHFNATDPLTREVSKNEITRMNNHQGYASDWFMPSEGIYKLYFQGTLGQEKILIPIANTKNKTIWTNHGEAPLIRRFKLVFNKKDQTYYADFQKTS